MIDPAARAAWGRRNGAGDGQIGGRWPVRGVPREGVCQSELQVRKGTHPPRFTARQGDSRPLTATRRCQILLTTRTRQPLRNTLIAEETMRSSPPRRVSPTNQNAPKPRPLQEILQNGASETRTRDLLGAIQALFQLSYSPVRRRLPRGGRQFSRARLGSGDRARTMSRYEFGVGGR